MFQPHTTVLPNFCMISQDLHPYYHCAQLFRDFSVFTTTLQFSSIWRDFSGTTSTHFRLAKFLRDFSYFTTQYRCAQILRDFTVLVWLILRDLSGFTNHTSVLLNFACFLMIRNPTHTLLLNFCPISHVLQPHTTVLLHFSVTVNVYPLPFCSIFA
jgi:hypothetical protein